VRPKGGAHGQLARDISGSAAPTARDNGLLPLVPLTPLSWLSVLFGVLPLAPASCAVQV
jgi:hypothetical protein